MNEYTSEETKFAAIMLHNLQQHAEDCEIDAEFIKPLQIGIDAIAEVERLRAKLKSYLDIINAEKAERAMLSAENERLSQYAPRERDDSGETKILVDAEYFNELQVENYELHTIRNSLLNLWQKNQERTEQDDCLIESLRVENAELRASLRQIGQAVDPDDGQIENWIVGIVDTALGEVVK
jgi:hypothetical protein